MDTAIEDAVLARPTFALGCAQREQRRGQQNDRGCAPGRTVGRMGEHGCARGRAERGHPRRRSSGSRGTRAPSRCVARRQSRSPGKGRHVRGSPKVKRAVTSEDVHEVVLPQLARCARRAPGAVEREPENKGVEPKVRPPRHRDACPRSVSLLPLFPRSSQMGWGTHGRHCGERSDGADGRRGKDGGARFLGDGGETPVEADELRVVFAKQWPLRTKPSSARRLDAGGKEGPTTTPPRPQTTTAMRK